VGSYTSQCNDSRSFVETCLTAEGLFLIEELVETCLTAEGLFLIEELVETCLTAEGLFYIRASGDWFHHCRTLQIYEI